MYIKTIHKNQIHKLNIQPIQTIEQLNSILLKIYKNISNSYCIQAQINSSRITIDSDQAIRQLKNNQIGKIRLYIMDKCGQQVKQDVRQVDADKNRDKQIQNDNIINNAEAYNKQSINIPEITQKQINQPQHTNPIQQQHKQQQTLFICQQCTIKYTHGILYRCALCNNYNICQHCQNTTTHDHPFIKIKNIQYKNMKIFAILQSDLHKQHEMDSKQNRGIQNNGQIGINKQENNKYQHKQYKQIQQQEQSQDKKQEEQQNRLKNWWNKVKSVKRTYFDGLFNKNKNNQQYQEYQIQIDNQQKHKINEENNKYSQSYEQDNNIQIHKQQQIKNNQIQIKQQIIDNDDI